VEQGPALHQQSAQRVVAFLAEDPDEPVIGDALTLEGHLGHIPTLGRQVQANGRASASSERSTSPSFSSQATNWPMAC
jgi:hypothetical protein